VPTIGLPVKFSQTPGAVLHAAPLFGQHTREVLGELGYDGGQIEAIIAAGAARCPT
jgi:crotonobetainyl-CoA:carnitine CoA-transferase CaiB-like acyl-CoA transferase